MRKHPALQSDHVSPPALSGGAPVPARCRRPAPDHVDPKSKGWGREILPDTAWLQPSGTVLGVKSLRKVNFLWTAVPKSICSFPGGASQALRVALNKSGECPFSHPFPYVFISTDLLLVRTFGRPPLLSSQSTGGLSYAYRSALARDLHPPPGSRKSTLPPAQVRPLRRI